MHIGGYVLAIPHASRPTVCQFAVVSEFQHSMGPDLQNILRQSYGFLTIIPNLPSTYYRRLIYQAFYKKHNANSYVRLACKIVRLSEIVFVN